MEYQEKIDVLWTKKRNDSIKTLSLIKFWSDITLPELGDDIRVAYGTYSRKENWGYKPGPAYPALFLTYIGPARSAEEAHQTLIDVQYLLRVIFDHPKASQGTYTRNDLEYSKRWGHPLSHYNGMGKIDGHKICVMLSVPWLGEGCVLETITVPATEVLSASCPS